MDQKKQIEIQIRTNEMHEFAQRGIASHWKYKSSEKFSELSWKEYDWLRDLVEIIEAGTSPEHYYEFTKLQMFQENVFCFTPKGAVIKLPKKATPIDFAYAVHTKVGNSAIGCTINGQHSTLQTILKNGDLVNIETSKNASPSLHWLSSSATGKARSAIRRYWQDKSTENFKTAEKNYSSTIEVDLPHKPGVLGHITSLIGLNKGNIINLEIIKRKKEHLTFSFDLQIKDLKNFTNLISQIKQSNLSFKIIRHKQKKMLSSKESLKILKETKALIEGHFILSSGLHSPKYVQCAQLMSKPSYALKICESLAEKIKSEFDDFNLILSPAMGGIIVGYELGKLLNKRAIFSERVNGEFKLRRDFNIKEGDKVLIVEDVITTGKSSIECSKLITSNNAKIIGYACIIDRSNGRSEIKEKIISQVELNIPTYSKDNLPKELLLIDAVKPGSRNL